MKLSDVVLSEPRVWGVRSVSGSAGDSCSPQNRPLTNP